MRGAEPIHPAARQPILHRPGDAALATFARRARARTAPACRGEFFWIWRLERACCCRGVRGPEQGRACFGCRERCPSGAGGTVGEGRGALARAGRAACCRDRAALSHGCGPCGCCLHAAGGAGSDGEPARADGVLDGRAGVEAEELPRRRDGDQGAVPGRGAP